MSGFHFFVEINGGQWHRTEGTGTPGVVAAARCTCNIAVDDPRVLKVRDHSDDSWDFAPKSQVAMCFPESMRNPPKPPLDDATKATVLDGYTEAADKMLQLAAENQQLTQRIAEYEMLFGHALSTDEFLQQLLAGLGGQLPDGTPRTVEGIVSAVADVVLRLDCHEDASTPAFDEIAALCGCPEWEYPGQVIRDVEHVVRERDGLKTELRDVMVARDHLAAKLQLAERIRDDARAESNAKIESVRFWRDQTGALSAEVLRLSADNDRLEQQRNGVGHAGLRQIEQLQRELQEAKELAESRVQGIIELQQRRDDLLKLVAKLSNEVPFPDEWKNWESQRAKLVAEVGTLRSTADEHVRMTQHLQLQLDRVVEQKDCAYSERDKCVAGLAALAARLGWSAWLGKHVGDPWDHDWRNIVFINLPTGQVSWHIHDSELPLFDFLDEIPERTWDGHTTEQKYERLIGLTTRAAPYEVQPGKPGCPDCGSNFDRLVAPYKTRIDELEANAARMREYRFSLEGIPTDGNGNPVDPELVADTQACGCSEKYKELAPGIHAKYCPLKGLPLERA